MLFVEEKMYQSTKEYIMTDWKLPSWLVVVVFEANNIPLTVRSDIIECIEYALLFSSLK